ncbi:MAG: hypothetical protein GY874_03915 [Desulfobacteraceae bacterium]|nr:hypothetical protein [Desulfobacteraceae bacterium]
MEQLEQVREVIVSIEIGVNGYCWKRIFRPLGARGSVDGVVESKFLSVERWAGGDLEDFSCIFSVLSLNCLNQ